VRARGQVLQSQDQFEGLLDRGAIIHRDHGAEAVERIQSSRPQELLRLWSESTQQPGRVLQAQIDAEFEETLQRSARPVVALVQRDPGMAILEVVRPPDVPVTHYANRHALHAAIAGQLAAQRLGCGAGAGAGKSLFRAALTMNLGMAELQNRLAAQVTPLTALRRQVLHDHSQQSVELPQTASVSDHLWLDAVAQHHERPGGSGYPRRLGDVGELALLLKRVDACTACVSACVLRQALPADVAVRQLLAADPKSPLAAAVVREFGLDPPGCAVRAGLRCCRAASVHSPGR
jgi:response regulator RpfG family c-di-GMP phosphodiesterase